MVMFNSRVARGAVLIERPTDGALVPAHRNTADRDLGVADEAVFEWIGPDDHRTTDACEWLKEQTEGGVTMDRLVELQREAQRKFFPDLDRFRRHVVHPNERHSFSEAFSTKSIAGATGDIEVEVDTVPGGLDMIAG